MQAQASKEHTNFKENLIEVMNRYEEKAPTFVGTFSLLVAEAGFEPTTSGL
jgi:hypothetical protein